MQIPEPQLAIAQGSGGTPCYNHHCHQLIEAGERCLADEHNLWCSRECWDHDHTFVFVEHCQTRIYKRVYAGDLTAAMVLYEDNHPDIEADSEPVDANYLLRVEDPKKVILWQPALQCPQCGSQDIAHSEFVNRIFRHYEVRQGRIVFTSASDQIKWDATKDASLWCNACNTEFPIPADVELDFG